MLCKINPITIRLGQLKIRVLILKELRHDILSCFFGSLKIVVNWMETFK